jgi:hypothetical protein
MAGGRMTHRWFERLCTFALSAVMAWLLAASAYAQADDCKRRGQLDTLYCDEDGDLVADAPKGPLTTPKFIFAPA